MSPATTRQDAIGQITTLAREHGLTRADLLKALDDVTPGEKETSLIQKVLSYIGGAFVFCGICTYVGLVWDDLDSAARVIITLGSGFVAFLLSLLALGDPKYVRASTPLLLIGAALQPTGLFVFMYEYLPPSGDVAKAACFVFGFMLVQQAIAFYARQRTSLLFFTLLFFYLFMSAFMEKADIDSQLSVLTLGISGLLVSWVVNKTEHQAIAPFYFFFGALGVTAASFDYLQETPFDILLVGVVAALIYVSILASSRALLTVSILALLGYLIYFTEEYFKDVVGWPIAMVIIGLIMIGVSSYAVKLGKKMAHS